MMPIWSRQHILFKCSNFKSGFYETVYFQHSVDKLIFSSPNIFYCIFVLCTGSISLTNSTFIHVTLNYYGFWILLITGLEFELNEHCFHFCITWVSGPTPNEQWNWTCIQESFFSLLFSCPSSYRCKTIYCFHY